LERLMPWHQSHCNEKNDWSLKYGFHLAGLFCHPLTFVDAPLENAR